MMVGGLTRFLSRRTDSHGGPTKIKIAYFINELRLGGAERALVRITSRLSSKDNKYEILVITFRTGSDVLISELRNRGVRVISLEAKSKGDLLAISKLYTLLRSEGIHILWCSLFHATIVGRIIGRMVGVPIIVNWEHNTYLGDTLRRLVNRATMPFTDCIFADSHATGAAVSRVLNISTEKLHVVPIAGIDFSLFRPAVVNPQGDRLTIGSVGKLEEQKGYSFLLRAAQKLVREYRDISFIIIGDGSLRPKLERMVAAMGLTTSFKFLGWRSDVPHLLAHMSIYVQPSLWEGMCITVVEAMASGLPIVGTNVGGIPESVEHGKSGYLVPPADVDALANALANLIANPSERLQMGKEARKRAGQSYSLDEMVRELEKHLDILIETKLHLRFDAKKEAQWRPTDSTKL